MKIATGASRMQRVWNNTETTWEEILQRLDTPKLTAETVAEYHTMSRDQQAAVKDVGGFVAGHLQEGRRKNGHITCRSMLTLDLDFPLPDLWDSFTLLQPWRAAMYSTHSHTPERPRLRLLVPLIREVGADEYEAIARKLAQEIGIDQFDDTTFEAARLMYWPSTPSDAEYLFKHQDGPLLDVDEYLNSYLDWRDVSSWPVSSRQTKALRALGAKQVDPTEKAGMVGMFCRAYDVPAAIETFLNDIYVKTSWEDRYTYAPGESSAGVVIHDNGTFAYSHHSTDPAGGLLLNAFDLVRIHLYSALDDEAKAGTPTNRLPSYKAMSDLAKDDTKVKQLITTERINASDEFAPVEITDTSWVDALVIRRDGKIEDTAANFELIIANDPRLASIGWNEQTEGPYVRDPGKLPWAQVKPGWSDSDEANLRVYVERIYGIYNQGRARDAMISVSTTPRRRWHPIKEHLDGLPEWDGLERVETLLIDVLGAEDNAYVRAATRKTLIAAIERIYRPGAKFDSALILQGPQGIGKSTVWAKLGGDWFSDSLTISDMQDKTSAEKLQGYWILELSELQGMRKIDVETVKGFLTRQVDRYRAAYGRTVEAHPRQCIVVGTTNAENGFLRDITGNRRFWPVSVSGAGDKGRPWDLDEETVRQIWAETLSYFKAGEQLYLTGEAAALAAEAQTGAMETDEREGLVRAYLEAELPDNWSTMSTFERRNYLSREPDFASNAAGGNRQRQTVSNIEIWAECLGENPAKMTTRDSYAITAIMSRIEGWEKVSTPRRTHLYGSQRGYKRRLQVTTSSNLVVNENDYNSNLVAGVVAGVVVNKDASQDVK